MTYDDVQSQLDEIALNLFPETRGRKRVYAGSAVDRHRQAAAMSAKRAREETATRIAVLDMETDPFDNRTRERIEPFLAVLYSDDWPPVIIWESSAQALIEKLWVAILDLKQSYTIYAHNGGKFDYMFLIHKIRGQVSFKGRGIMSATIQGKHAAHTLRDSYHLIPEALASLKKDKFAYERMNKNKREQYRQDIIKYCLHDCEYLLDWLKDFIGKYGRKLTIGQASMAVLKQSYKVDRLSEGQDTSLRPYYMGGRVECLVGRIHLKEHMSMFDTNSMYPYVMAHFAHPISNTFLQRRGRPGSKTIFIKLYCRNRGALMVREGGETTSSRREGVFWTTIWEYDCARRYGLIDDVDVLCCVDFDRATDFSQTILPLYEAKREASERRSRLEKGTLEHDVASKDYTFSKLFQNNLYGKFAQNPRLYVDRYITDWGERPPKDWFDKVNLSMDVDERALQRKRMARPSYECEDYAIWERPSPSRRYNNVATAASITGAARAVLMDAMVKSDYPVYCDTDSLICRELRCEVDPVKLGAWKLEKEYEEIIINGKKLYAAVPVGGGKPLVKCKGVQAYDPVRSPNGLKFSEMRLLYQGYTIDKTGSAPTFTRTGSQNYITREVKATAEVF